MDLHATYEGFCQGPGQGHEIRLAPRGAGRYFSAAFVMVWLCGWAAAEAFVLWILIKGAAALLTGQPPGPGREPLVLGPALAVGAFLILWPALWTLGGVVAIGAVLKMLWAHDRVDVSGGRLIVTHARGLFRTSREIGRDAIRRVALAPKGDRLVVETDRATIELSSLGTRDERGQAAATLRAVLGLSEVPASDPAVVPEGWEELVTPEGERALVPDLATRRTQARVAGVMAMAAGAVAFLIGRAALNDPPLFGLAFIALAAAVALGAGAIWLARGRNEWRIGSGRLTLRRRYAGRVRDLFEARRLEVTVETDSDGDDLFVLEAVGEGAPALEPASSRKTFGRTRGRKPIARAMNDPSTPRRLGAWLARVAEVPLEDCATREARDADVARLTEQLAGSGRLGKWAADMLAGLHERRRRHG